MLRARIVVMTSTGSWIRDMQLAIAPFPGLGIRVDTYEIINVDSVVVGDRGCDVTCIGHLEGEPEAAADSKLTALGFELAPYP